MMRRQPMNRGGKAQENTVFKPRAVGISERLPAGAGSDYEAAREQRLEERAARTMAGVVPRASSMGEVALVPCPKPPVILESEAYRRAVASLPCICCGIVGYSQHAHANQGKGLGLKTDDRTGFPLCCTRPGVLGCHAKFDQYIMFPREQAREAALEWGFKTRALVLALGLWPRRLPLWPEVEPM